MALIAWSTSTSNKPLLNRRGSTSFTVVDALRVLRRLPDRHLFFSSPVPRGVGRRDLRRGKTAAGQG